MSYSKQQVIHKKIHLRNMVCNCCIYLLNKELSVDGIEIHEINLGERFGMSYPYISSLFSKHENTTLEKFIILHKIEKVKQLIEYGELTLSEIAYMMGYSSVQYLSTQFKSVTGISVTGYKTNPSVKRKSLEQLKY